MMMKSDDDDDDKGAFEYRWVVECDYCFDIDDSKEDDV